MSGSDSEASTDRTDAASMLQIRVLGPLEIAWGGRVIDLGGVKARALIARLLIDRSLIVSVDRLVDSLWGDHDGDGAEIALRSTISRLRKRLREAGCSRRPDRDPRPGVRARGRGGRDRCLEVRADGRRRPSAPGPPAPERIGPCPVRGPETLAGLGLQRGAGRALRPGRGASPRGVAPGGDRDPYRRRADRWAGTSR